jgi:Mn-containing catalase
MKSAVRSQGAGPDARFGTYLLEQFGDATAEPAALQYWAQSFHVENAGIRDMLQDLAIESSVISKWWASDRAAYERA